MTTQCMQTRIDPRGDLLTAVGPRQSGIGSSLERLYAALVDAAGRFAAGFSRARRRRAALRALSRLSDRQLTDIGLHRAQLGDVVEAMLRAEDRGSHRGAR